MKYQRLLGLLIFTITLLVGCNENEENESCVVVCTKNIIQQTSGKETCGYSTRKRFEMCPNWRAKTREMYIPPNSDLENTDLPNDRPLE